MTTPDLNRLPKTCAACGAPGEWVWSESSAEWFFERTLDAPGTFTSADMDASNALGFREGYRLAVERYGHVSAVNRSPGGES